MEIKTLKNRAKAPHYNDAGHPDEGNYIFTDYELYEYTKLVCEKQRESDASKVNDGYEFDAKGSIKENDLIVNINDFNF